MRFIAPAFILAAMISALPTAAQAQMQTASGAIGPEDTAKVKQVFVYGEDPCPKSEGDEIVVCARLPDNDRYRIPTELRSDPNAPANQAWGNRARAIEYVGAEGTNSCSVTGGGGFTGWFQQMARQAKEERKTLMGSATWADAVSAERQKRLGNIDADSEAIEKEAKLDEAQAEARARREAEARRRAEAEDKAAAAAQQGTTTRP